MAPSIQPLRLLKLLKGAYGLTEAPRLWYLRARQMLTDVGSVELGRAKATFVFRVGSELLAMLVLRIDDGMLMGREAPSHQE